jgi:2-methylcitrate dehydratase PrpD
MTVSDSLAKFIAECPASAIPDAVRRQAVLAITENYALMTVGSTEGGPRALQASTAAWAAGGPCEVAGRPDLHVDPCTAAFLNGAAAHALDFDAISYGAVGFTGSAITAALAALAQVTPILGSDAVTAFCIGWEAGAALGRGINPLHYSKGWHPTATMALFAATAACCRVKGFNAKQTMDALSVAVADASGVKIMIGNMVNVFHVGKAARNAIVAATLAENGFVGHPDPFASTFGFLNVFQGEGTYDAELIGDSLGNPWDLAEPGAVFKVYPCCGLIHTGLDIIYELREEHNLAADDIKSVVVRLHEFVPGVMHVDVPTSGYAAKFSVPYTVALGLSRPRVGIEDFDEVDPAVVELGRLVSMEVHPDLHGGETFWEREFTEVEVVTSDGTFTKRKDRLKNLGIAATADTPAMKAKFDNCLIRAASAGASGGDPDVQWARLAAMDSTAEWSLWNQQQ